MADAADLPEDVRRATDRVAIQELMASYMWALGDRDWGTWRAVFADDAHLDYSTAGGPVGDVATAAAWLETTLSGFAAVVGHGADVVVRFDRDDRDRAVVRSHYRMMMKLDGDPPTRIEAIGSYADVVVRTADGWRIAERVEHLTDIR